jgi:hypothetical protein
MAGWIMAAGGSDVDVVARAVGIAGLVVAITSVTVTWQLWRHSGAEIAVRVRVRSQVPLTLGQNVDGVEVINMGRMDAVIREIRMVPAERPLFGTDDFWYAMDLELVGGEYPLTIPPTGFALAVLKDPDRPRGAMLVQGRAIRGDGRTFVSPKMRLKRLPIQRANSSADPPPGSNPNVAEGDRGE